MDIYSLIEQRQSDRKYDGSRKVEPEKIQRIVEAARLAPSACNSQPWRMIVVDDSDKCKEITDAVVSLGMNGFAVDVPVHIVIVEEAPNFTARLGGWVKNKHFPNIDCGILASHITLAATAEGLGSCILGWFDQKKIRKSLSIPSSKRVILDIVIGYSIDKQRNKARKPTEKVISHNKY